MTAVKSPPSVGSATEAADPIPSLRERINEIDCEIISLWRERAGLARRVGEARLAGGGTRLALAREQEIIQRYRAALGRDGSELALLVLRGGRGPL